MHTELFTTSCSQGTCTTCLAHSRQAPRNTYTAAIQPTFYNCTTSCMSQLKGETTLNNMTSYCCIICNSNVNKLYNSYPAAQNIDDFFFFFMLININQDEE